MGKGIRIHYLNNPAFGLLPILLYCILVCFINIDIAIYISLLTNCIFYFANRLFYRKNLLLFVSKIVFLLLLSSLGLFFIEETFIKAFVYVPVFIELLLAIIIIRIFYFKKIKSVRLIYNSHLKIYHQNARQRTFEFIYLINVIFFSLLIYLFIISCLFLTGIVSFNDFSDVRIVNILRVCLLTAIIIYTQIKMVFVNYKFSKEDWLPIINDDVRVIGKIAKSVSYKFK